MALHLTGRRLSEVLGSGGRPNSKTRQSSASLAGMLLVAAAGAILNWSWWLEYALITPFAVWLIASGRLVVYRQLRSGSSDRRVPIVLVVPVLLAAAIQPTRWSGLVAVAAFIVLFIFGRHRGDSISTTATAL